MAPWINGRKVTEDLFLPGWPDYIKRSYYVAYDVTRLLQSGPNAMGLALGDGWYSSSLIGNSQYGQTPMVSGWIEITDASGKATIANVTESGKPLTELREASNVKAAGGRVGFTLSPGSYQFISRQ